MPTIKDIAREAGVSHGTVSNVLNKTGKVSIEKIRLVEEAAKRLGYVPNTQAQMLRIGTPTSIAVILPTLKETNYLDFYTALQNSLSKLDYDTVIYTTDDVDGNEKAILSRLPLSRLAAIVTISCLVKSEPFYYHGLPCPVLYVERLPEHPLSNQACLSFDFQAVGTVIGQYILDKGYHRIAFFCARRKLGFTKELFYGLTDTLENQEAAIQCFTSDLNLIVPKAFDTAQSDFNCDVVLTSNTMRAEATAFAFHHSGVKQPPEIITIGSSENPQFSIYRLDYGQLGLQASELIMKQLLHNTPMPAKTLLSAKGFSYQFPQLVRLAPQTLTMLTLDTPSVNALEKLLPMLEETSGIKVQITRLLYDDLHSQVTMLNQKFHYDMIRMDVARLDTLGQQTYLPLEQIGITPENLPQKLISPAYDNYSMIGGTRYTLPFDPSVQLFLYRLDLFEDATLKRAYYERFHETLSVPETVEQYLHIAEFFTKSHNPDSPTKYGTTMTCGSALVAASDFLPYYLASGHQIFDQKHFIRINTPEMIEAMKNYLKMTCYAAPQQWWLDSIKLFADGNVATTAIYSNYAAMTMNSKRSNIVGQIGAGIIPGRHPMLGGGAIGVSRFSSQIEACRQFFLWFYSPDIASLLTRLGGTSPLSDIYNDFRNYSVAPWLDVVKKTFEIGQRGTSSVQIPGFSIHRYEFALGTAIRNLISGVMNPQEAAAFAQTIYDTSTLP